MGLPQMEVIWILQSYMPSFFPNVARCHLEYLLETNSYTHTHTHTIQAALANTPDFDAALSGIAIALHLTVLEHIDNSASLYGCSIANQHVCFLVKSGVSV